LSIAFSLSVFIPSEDFLSHSDVFSSVASGVSEVFSSVFVSSGVVSFLSVSSLSFHKTLSIHHSIAIMSSTQATSGFHRPHELSALYISSKFIVIFL